MSVVSLFHLGLFLGRGARVVFDAAVLVVVGRSDIFIPEVAGGDLNVVEVGGFFNGWRVTPGSTGVENPGRGTPVAFALGSGTGRHGVQALTPDEAVAAESALPEVSFLFPAATDTALVERQGNMRGVPALCDADEALPAFSGNLKVVGFLSRREGDEENKRTEKKAKTLHGRKDNQKLAKDPPSDHGFSGENNKAGPTGPAFELT